MRSIICPKVSSGVLLLLLCVHINLKWVNSFSPSFASTTRSRHAFTLSHGTTFNNDSGRQQRLCMSTGNELSEVPPGKVVVRSYLYRFSPTQQSVENKYAIEERQYYSVGEDKSLKLLGDKSIIFREDWSVSLSPGDENKNVAMVGPALYTLQGLQDEKDSEGLGGSVLESCYAMALYCMHHPEIVSGKGLEVGSGVGFGGILSSIGAGVASGSTQQVASDGEPESPVPSSLSKIMLTDSNEKFLETCIDNLDASYFPGSSVQVGFFDWNKRVPSGLKDQFDFIIGCDTVKSHAEINPLAKVVGNCLKGGSSSSSYVHIGPQYRENMNDLALKLGRGYGMRTGVQNLAVERMELMPLFFGWEDVESQAAFETGNNVGGYFEYRNSDTSIYSALVCQHENADFESFDEKFSSSNKNLAMEGKEAKDSIATIPSSDKNDNQVISQEKHSITSLELLTFADFAASSITDAASLSMAVLALVESASILNTSQNKLEVQEGEGITSFPPPCDTAESESESEVGGVEQKQGTESNTEEDVPTEEISQPNETITVQKEEDQELIDDIQESFFVKSEESKTSLSVQEQIPKSDPKEIGKDDNLDEMIDKLRSDTKGFQKGPKSKSKRKKSKSD